MRTGRCVESVSPGGRWATGRSWRESAPCSGETSCPANAAGNLTYDGLYQYVYDAWNRLVEVKRAYRDAGGTLQVTSTVATIRYDALGRRVSKAVTNSADWDATYHYYFTGRQMIETRDGSNDVLTQHVWGAQYVDELVQVGHNDDPEDAGEDDCETFYYACHNANFNVMGIVAAGGDLKERYEYTPYGQRSVFKSPGSNDALCMAPVLESQRVEVSGQPQPYGLCDVGHQGLLQDKEFGLIYNRARYVHPRLGRFVSPDPKGHADGVNPHASRLSNPFFYLDPDGRAATPCQDYYDDMWRAYRAAEELRKDIEEALEQLNNTPSGLDRFHEWEDLLRKQVEFLRRLAEAHAKLGKLHECCVEQWKKGQKRVAKPGFVPERDAMRNGCGPDEWPWRRTIPNRVFGWDFEPACNAHDVCDTVCGKDRVKCASAFRNDLYAECDRKERRGSWWWNRCRAVAILYADMVWDYGEKAYWKGQLEGCQCP